MVTPDLIKLELQRRLLKQSFYVFYKWVWSIIDPAPFEDRTYLSVVINQFEQLLTTDNQSKIILNVPPRHGKSKLTAAFQAWCFARNPNYKILAVSHTYNLVTTLARDVRRIMTSDRFQAMFPESRVGCNKLSVDKQIEFTVGYHNHGFFKGFSIFGRPQGQGADLLFSDDLIGSTLDCTPEHLAKVYTSYKENFRSRAQPTGLKEILIQTRYHQDDPAGRFLKEEPTQWCHIKFPMIADNNLLNKFEYRKPGEPLTGTVETAEKLRNSQTPRAWGSLYQQNPIPQKGAIFHSEWFETYAENQDQIFINNESIPKDQLIKFIVVDPATGKKKSDSTTIGVFGLYNQKVYLLRLIDEKLNMLDTFDAIKKLMKEEYYISSVWIESTAYQVSLVQMGQKHALPFRELHAKGDKRVRAEASVPFFAQKRCYLPKNTLRANTAVMLTQLLSFDGKDGHSDDIVDVLTYMSMLVQTKQVGVLDVEPIHVTAKHQPVDPVKRYMSNQDEDDIIPLYKQAKGW